MWCTSVIEGQHVHDDGTGAQCRPLGRLCGHGAHQADDHDLQPSTGGAGRQVQVCAGGTLGGADEAVTIQQAATRQLLDLCHCVEHPSGDIFIGRFDGGGGFSACDQVIAVTSALDEDSLRGGRATVSGQYSLELPITHIGISQVGISQISR